MYIHTYMCIYIYIHIHVLYIYIHTHNLWRLTLRSPNLKVRFPRRFWKAMKHSPTFFLPHHPFLLPTTTSVNLRRPGCP